MRAPFPADPLDKATALLSLPTFCRFTTICEPLKSSEPGRFSEDMIAIVVWEVAGRRGWVVEVDTNILEPHKTR